MGRNLIDSTSAYEAWLSEMTDVQQRAVARKHDDQRLASAPTLLRLMGFETANIHLGSRAPEELIESLQKLAQNSGWKWLDEATERMVNATHKDHRAWAEHH